MVTPTREAIIDRAFELALKEQAANTLPMIVPTEAELRESSFYTNAQRELMRESREPYHQQLDYLRQVAEEIGHTIIDKRELRNLERCCARAEVPVKKVVPPIKKVVRKPIVKKIKKFVPRPRLRRRRIPVGVTEFSDQEWGIRPKR